MKKNWQRLLFLEIFLFGLLYSLLSLCRHLRFDSFAFDLGIFDQIIWLYSRWQAPFSTIKEKIIFGDHFNPSLILLAPLFWLWDDVRILLIFQSFFLSLSAYPVFLLAKAKKIPNWLSLIISAIYLSFFGFQHAINFDFHAAVIAASLIPWLILFLKKKQYRHFIFLAIIFVGFKENLALTLTAIGIIVCLKKEIKKGLLIIVFSLVYFWLVINKIIPWFSLTGYEYQPSLPSNIREAIMALFWPEQKLVTWLHSLGWFSFLPLLAPITLIPITADLAQYFLAGEKYASTWGLFMHYRACLAPFLVWGMIEGIAKFKKRFFILGFLILALPLYWQYSLHLPLNRLSKAYYWQEEQWMKDNRQLISQIPAKVSVVAQNNLVPHLSHRSEIYLAWPRQKDDQWWLFWQDQPEYLIVDLHKGQWLTHLLVDSERELSEAVHNLEKAGQIKLKTQINDARLYKIIYNNKER